MKAVLSLLLSFGACAAFALPFNEIFRSGKKGPYDFCNGLECPKFKVENKTDEYEVRCYQAYKWASTVVTDYTFEKASYIGFMRLFDYISGENVKEAKIPMTAPVLNQIQPAQGPFCKNNFTMSFFQPFEDQDAPISPTSKDVFISSTPTMCVYVRTYPGFGANTDAIQKNSLALAESLEKAGLGDTYDKEVLYYAGYDSPFHLENRHNDIWFVRKSKL